VEITSIISLAHTKYRAVVEN